MRISIPYGHVSTSFEIPEKNLIGLMDPPETPALADLKSAIEGALDHPVGSGRLEDILSPGQSVAVIIDDISRPTPQAQILPHIIERILLSGIRKEAITVVVALGSHRYMTKEELRARVGREIFDTVRVINSEFKDPDGLLYVGDTPEGVPIKASKAVMEADVHIGVGCLVPHPVMGWGGGGKILYPGIAGEETVAYFHLKASLYDENLFGKDTTPVRDMMETWVDAIGLHFIVNVVLNAKSEVTDVVAGHYIKAHREGVKRGKISAGFRVREKADVMIASSHPADQDFWQSPKALYAAEAAMKGASGGVMILVSPNEEGVGPHPEYPACMGRDDGDEIVKACMKGEAHGDPLAIAVGNSMSKLRRRRRLIVVGDGVTKEEMALCGCEHVPLSGLQELIDRIISDQPDCRIGVLSNGAETFLYE